MSDLIAFLESVGQDADLRYASAEELGESMEHARIEPGLQSAVLAGDIERIRDDVGGRVVSAIMFPAEEEEEEEEDGEGEEEEFPDDDR